MNTSSPSTRVFDLGRNVFLAAECAVFDDFSRVTDANLKAAVAYGSCQVVLPARSRTVLRGLKAELKRRTPAVAAA